MTRPMSEEREKLEPCPFCGRQPEFNKLFAWCWGPPSAPHQLVSQYHETWRTRSTSSAERGMREAWRTDIENAPKDGTPFLAMWPHTVRWKAYRPGSPQLAKGIAGRWQKSNGYGGWDNCDEPHSFTLAALSSKGEG